MSPPAFFFMWQSQHHLLCRVLKGLCCKEVLHGFAISKPSGFVNPPTWLSPSLGRGKAMVTMSRHFPLVTLCSPARGKGCSSVGVAVDAIEGEVLGASEAEVTTTMKGGMGLSPVVDPSFVGSIADHVGGPTLVL